MQAERRRELRYPFIAMAEIVDDKENARTSSRISDLSLHGCYVEMKEPFPPGSNVMLKFTPTPNSWRPPQRSPSARANRAWA